MSSSDYYREAVGPDWLMRMRTGGRVMKCANCGREVEPDGGEGEFGHVAARLPDDHPDAQEFWSDVCPAPDYCEFG